MHRSLFCSLIFATLLLTSCLQAVPPDTSLTQRFEQTPDNIVLQFSTEKGEQHAYYLAPKNKPTAPPARLVIAYPGINSLALSWLDVIHQGTYPDTAYLLIEYPGRGESEGFMRPEELYINSEKALQELAKQLKVPSLTSDLRLLSHSFGSGAALQFATRNLQIKTIVLVAPYDDLKHAVKQQSWFLSAIMPSQIDNRELLGILLSGSSPPDITIIHGGQDRNLPLSMSQELQQISPDKISLMIFPEDGHTDILHLRREIILQEINRD